MDRRTLLKSGALGLAGAGLSACGVRPGRIGLVRTTPPLVPVRASWDRVIRTTVGLRPHRPSGFVVRADRLDDRLLVHNFGHGGSGMSLSWGTAYLAADIAVQRSERRAAILGCGVVGLTTARQLQRRGFDVTIYAKAVPPNVTSNMSLAGWTPTSGLVQGSRRTPVWDAQFRQAAEIAYRQLQLLIGPKYGIGWIDTYALRDDEPGEGTGGGEDALLPEHLRTGGVTLGPGEHPFPTRYAIQRPTMRFEPSIYLDALVSDVQEYGGRIVIRAFDTLAEVAALDEPVVVNCTGLGAKELFGDPELIPVKGQLTALVPQPEVTYGTFGGLPGSEREFGIHMFPRSDGIILGGTSEEGVSTLEPNEQARQEIVDAQIALFDAMRRG